MCHSRVAGSLRRMRKPESPRLVHLSRPRDTSTVTMHAVALPLSPLARTAPAAACSTFRALFAPALTSAAAVSISCLENSPASMPCSRHMYTPSDTPSPITLFVLGSAQMKYASSPPYPKLRRMTPLPARFSTVHESGLGITNALPATCSGCSRTRTLWLMISSCGMRSQCSLLLSSPSPESPSQSPKGNSISRPSGPATRSLSRNQLSACMWSRNARRRATCTRRSVPRGGVATLKMRRDARLNSCEAPGLVSGSRSRCSSLMPSSPYSRTVTSSVVPAPRKSPVITSIAYTDAAPSCGASGTQLSPSMLE
mmetsp:Transcript_15907/g.40411  ORF Transcript_15907/g.40411 Transcript_15907/m.40411 type:complete len:312 (+) Transcript_15907:1732-2667(+)